MATSTAAFAQIAKDEWLLISIVAAIVVVVVLGLIANVILAPADASSSSSSPKKCASYSVAALRRRTGRSCAVSSHGRATQVRASRRSSLTTLAFQR
jgi:hypothetical protein